MLAVCNGFYSISDSDKKKAVDKRATAALKLNLRIRRQDENRALIHAKSR
jgi:hypothetical protein